MRNGWSASLRKAEIVEIYQAYLGRQTKGASAATNLCEFLEVDDLDDTVLNAGNKQRLMLVAANFRREVTSTVPGLIGHGIRWYRLDDKKTSRICYSHSFDGFNDENWPEMIDWLCKHIVKLEEAFSDPLGRLGRQLKSRSDALAGEDA